MDEKRILIMHISAVSGHKSAALAVEKALHAIDPQARVSNINAFTHTNPITTWIINHIYLQIIQCLPFVWRYLYDNPKIVKKTAKTKAAIHRANAPKLKALIDELRPHVIACSQAYPCGLVADMKKMYGLNIPLVAILTDYVPHSFWIYDQVDYYIVPSEDVKQRLVDKGVASNKILPLGIPIDPKFALSLNKNALKAKLGLHQGSPITLIMGGSHGLGPIKQIIRRLARSPADMQLIVVTGINRNLFRYLEKHMQSFKKNIKLYAYAENVHELMAVSDIIITKPGGVTVSEALVMGLPMVILKPIPGQEDNNTVYLIKHNAAIKIDDPKKINDIVTGLLGDPAQLHSLRNAARAMSNPSASIDIAKLLLSLCKDTQAQPQYV